MFQIVKISERDKVRFKKHYKEHVLFSWGKDFDPKNRKQKKNYEIACIILKTALRKKTKIVSNYKSRQKAEFGSFQT